MRGDLTLSYFVDLTRVDITDCPSIFIYTSSILLMFAFRWTGLLEEIAERLRSSKALLQLWQRYKELYEQSYQSIQLQEEMADQLLKTTCSKDIADEEVSDWIRECSVSEGPMLLLNLSMFLEVYAIQDGKLYL